MAIEQFPESSDLILLQDDQTIELSDTELDSISGGGRRHRGRSRRSGSRYSKRSRSISGQTIVNPDGSSVTSFAIHEEVISSESFQIEGH
jgi:bacteriocin-like protein